MMMHWTRYIRKFVAYLYYLLTYQLYHYRSIVDRILSILAPPSDKEQCQP